MDFKLRPARREDKERILEISSKIWEGEDYIPYVIEEWLEGKNSELCVAELDGKIISFSRYLRIFPGYVWLEGLRTDPDFQGKGAARAITAYLLDKARKEKALKVGLSIYVENRASLHITESFGFRKKASFIYLEKRPAEISTSGLSAKSTRLRGKIVVVSPEEALAFITQSRFLKAANGYFPCGWRFFSLSLNPEALLSELKVCLGIKKGRQVSSLLCSCLYSKPYGGFSLDFLEGPEEEMEALVKHVLEDPVGFQVVEAPMPQAGEAPPALTVLKKLSFKSWNNYSADEFVYELDLI